MSVAISFNMQTYPRILCVDDDPNILEGFRRQLRGKFEVEISTSPLKALEILHSDRKFSVVVSDMRMPVMDGVEFLKNVQKISPLTVRVMLTGNADQTTAAKAVNEGQIFRFVNKPCSSQELESVLTAANQQFNLLNAEKELLQNTLSGSIKVLSEILSLSDPVAFGVAGAIREPVRKISKILEIKNTWELDLAAMLHSIGWITVPESVKAKFRKGEQLKLEEQQMIERVPELGNQFIGRIPRLENVGRIILYCEKSFNGSGFPNDEIKKEQIPEAARIIHIAKALIKKQAEGIGWQKSIQEMLDHPTEFDHSILKRLLSSEDASSNSSLQKDSYAIQPSQLCVGQRLTEDLFCADGRLLIATGAYLSELICKSILNYAQSGNLKLPIMVDAKIPKSKSAEKVGVQ